MEEIVKLIIADRAKAIGILTAQGKDIAVIEKIMKEYKNTDRKIRDSQVGSIQIDKPVNAGTEKAKTVKGVRIPVPFIKKIVGTSAAFEIGQPVTLIPNFEGETESKLDQLLKRMWKVNRVDAALTKLLTLKKSETQAAMVFSILDVKEGSLIQKVFSFLGITNQKKEIKISILENSKGNMYPYFDAFGNMLFFTWVFTSKDAEGKEIKNTWIYGEKNLFKIAGDALPEIEVHGFDRIPVVYVSQDEPEWYDAQALIDRYEVALSKLGASNDYSGHPMLKIFGTVENAPDKDEDGKAWVIPIKTDDEGKEVKGDVQFLTADTAPASNELELKTIEKLIHYITSTPMLSFSTLMEAGIGNLSGKAIKLLFLDAIIKASSNEGENRTMVERIINVFISGMVTTTNQNMKKESDRLYYDVQFNSILPDDLKEAVEIVTSAVEAGVMSIQTGVEFIAMGDDTQAELDRIAADKTAKEPQTV